MASIAWKIGAETTAQLAGALDRARRALDENRPAEALDDVEQVLRTIDQVPRAVLLRYDRTPLHAWGFALGTLAAGQLNRGHEGFTVDRCIDVYRRYAPSSSPLDASALRDYARLIRAHDRVDGAPVLAGAALDPGTIGETARWLHGRQAHDLAEDLLHRSVFGRRPLDTGLAELLVDCQEARGDREAAAETAIRAGQDVGADGRASDALVLFRHALRLAPDSAAALYGAAAALAVLDRWSEAYPLVGKLLATGPATSEVAVLASRVYLTVDRLEDALEVIAYLPDDPELRAMRARILFALNDHAAGMSEVDRLLADSPDDPELLRIRADALAEHGDSAAAADAYEAVVAAGAESSDVVLRLADVLREADRSDDAIAAYERAAALDPTRAQPHAARAELLLELDRVEPALAAAGDALAIDVSHALALEVRADALVAAGRPADAIPVYRSLLRAVPRRLSAWRGLAEALRTDGRTAEALQAAVDGLAVAPEDGDLATHRAVLLADAGEWEEALPLLERAIGGDHSYSDAYLHGYLAEGLRQQGRNDEALRHMDLALAGQPDDAWLIGTRGQILRALGEPGAVDDLRRAVELDDSLGWAYADLGDALRLTGDATGALDALDRALELDPADADTWASKGAAEMALDRYDAGERSLDRAIELTPGNAFAYGVRAQLRAFICRDADALADADTAVGLDPEFGYAWVTRGFLLYARDDAEAEASFRRAVELDEADHIARVGLAETLVRRGDEAAATPVLREVVERIAAVDAESLIALGWAHLWLREFDHAARRLGERTFVEPDYAGGYFDLGLALLCDGRGPLAVAEFARGAVRARATEHPGRRAFLLREARWDLARVLSWLGGVPDPDADAVARWLVAPDGPGQPDWRMQMGLTPEAYPCPSHAGVDLTDLVRASVANDPTRVSSLGYSRLRRRTPAEQPFVVIVRCPGTADDAHDVECAGAVKP